MRKILISTNMYKGSEFGQILPYLKRFPGQVGVEVFPMFHEECFEKNLRDAMPLLKEVPVSFHGPYYQAEHSAAEGTVEYARTMELLEKTLSYAKELSSKYLVYHHNNCRIIIITVAPTLGICVFLNRNFTCTDRLSFHLGTCKTKPCWCKCHTLVIFTHLLIEAPHSRIYLNSRIFKAVLET